MGPRHFGERAWTPVTHPQYRVFKPIWSFEEFSSGPNTFEKKSTCIWNCEYKTEWIRRLKYLLQQVSFWASWEISFPIRAGPGWAPFCAPSRYFSFWKLQQHKLNCSGHTENTGRYACIRVHMDDTERMVNRKTKTDKTNTKPISDPNRYMRRCPDPN